LSFKQKVKIKVFAVEIFKSQVQFSQKIEKFERKECLRSKNPVYLRENKHPLIIIKEI